MSVECLEACCPGAHGPRQEPCTQISPGIPELVAALKAAGKQVFLVSGGFRVVIHPIAEVGGRGKRGGGGSHRLRWRLAASRLLSEQCAAACAPRSSLGRPTQPAHAAVPLPVPRRCRRCWASPRATCLPTPSCLT